MPENVTDVTIFTYAGQAPRNITVTDNRGVAVNWVNGGHGQLGVGFWQDDTGSSITSRGNNWVDLSLTAAIWNLTPPGC